MPKDPKIEIVDAKICSPEKSVFPWRFRIAPIIGKPVRQLAAR